MINKHKLFSLKNLIFSIILLFFLNFIIVPNINQLFGAPLFNVPIKLTQPNGKIINVFTSGDEFYNWVHDNDNFTIIRDSQTGYYVYAKKTGEILTPTDLIVGEASPEKSGLIKGINISENILRKIRNNYLKHNLELPQSANTPSRNLINNIVIFIRFSDEEEFIDNIKKYDSTFNNRLSNSLFNYYDEVSYGQLRISSTFYPQKNNLVYSYQDKHPRNYYQPYDSINNKIGYFMNPNDPYGDNRAVREFQLLYDAINSIDGQVPKDIKLDLDSDEKIDNVCFIISGNISSWSSMLWPHRWALWGKYAYINDKRVYDYNFQLQNSLSVSVLCHEMFHTIGAPDLYHYDFKKDISPCGVWDIMDIGSSHMSAYMKWKYGKWINDIPEITNSGVFSLSSLIFSPNSAYKIKSPFSDSEYFVLEYRKKFGNYESNLPGSGLLIYRINSKHSGNEHGPPDEIYLFRPGGSISNNGNPSEAFLNLRNGKILFGDTIDFPCFLSDGKPGGIKIRVGNIIEPTEPTSTIYFTIENPKNDFYTSSPNYSWINISQTGNIIKDWKNGNNTTTAALDNGWVSLPLKMKFQFYGKIYDSINVGINGLVSFTQKVLNSAAKYGSTATDSIGFYEDSYKWPGNTLFPNSIAVAYADFNLNPSDTYGGGKILYQTINNKFILSWENIGSFEKKGDTTNSFQLILDNSDNSILIQIKAIGNEGLRKKIKIGLQKDSSTGMSWFNSGSPFDRLPKDSTVIKFIPISLIPLDITQNQILQKHINLYQNYPNPFNPSTIIQYSLSTSGYVSLKIYDILGKEVKTLVNEYKSPGYYKSEFVARGLSGGIYFYTLRVGGEIITGRMILIK